MLNELTGKQYVKVKGVICPHCMGILHKTDVNGYKFVCLHCDENFMGFEVLKC